MEKDKRKQKRKRKIPTETDAHTYTSNLYSNDVRTTPRNNKRQNPLVETRREERLIRLDEKNLAMTDLYMKRRRVLLKKTKKTNS